MDMSVSITPDGTIDHQLYQKQSDSGVNLNYDSAIPMNVKMGVATQQFRRALSLSSGPELEVKSLEKIENLLKGNGYTDEAIRKALKRSKAEPKVKGEHPMEVSVLKLPFRSDDLHKQVNKLCKESKLSIRVVYEQGRSLQKRLSRSAYRKTSCTVHDQYVEQERMTKRSRGKPRNDCISCQCGVSPDKCDQQGVVYSLKCNICGDEYVGESVRTIRARTSEHHLQARNRKKDTPWGEHMLKHPEIQISKAPVFTGSVIATLKSHTQRKVREAIEIRERNPQINRTKGWTLT